MKGRKKKKQQLFFVYLDYRKKNHLHFFPLELLTDISVLRKNIFKLSPVFYLHPSHYFQVKTRDLN